MRASGHLWLAVVPLAGGIVLGLSLTPYWMVGHLFGAAVAGCFLWGTLRPNSGLFGPVVSRFPDGGDGVWLTIDDGPCPETTPVLLDLLEGHGVCATFFLVGERAQAHPELVLEIAKRGHGVGNHTMRHPQASFWGAGPRAAAREIGGCADALGEILGVRPGLFRAPVGHANPFVRWFLQEEGMSLIGWSNRGYDGVDGDVGRVLKKLGMGLAPGAIVLLHEGRASSAEILEGVLEEMEGRGLTADLPR